ncbi:MULTISPECIES: hypothetical protein [unclassified Oceanispirochaeta]|uniref:hypothetical protein n=1 Tax=unclassified Oceanispirochaeta TaxID=2635722 RepID=UPI000E09AD04|nr:MULTISPECIES: hypothetical protein [unclassified Oceanispirochaeta]MBF9015884.1 hypothetical protein [Oceanispirochaeta sp. M2]NPD72347.1 hypothetical protein [Oceanispirochaeta sp. M1]RDG32117.1 hypothetical protein DV872_09565 [Oceanispirochaeta sp. M1]
MRSVYSHGKRRRSRKTKLSLNRLLNRQPKTIRKHPHYELMINHYLASEKLQKLKINRQCYRLLDKAIITVENLPNLYRTYKVPQDPFFPLFITIKKDYLAERLKKIEEREKYILVQMKKLPREKRKVLRFLAELEESISPGGTRQIWGKKIYPGSMKRSREILKISESEWTEILDGYFESLSLKYPVFSKSREKVSASLFLRIRPSLNPLGFPSKETVNKSYRKLSRSYHPDSGGDASLFIRLQNSRDLLIKNIKE